MTPEQIKTKRAAAAKRYAAAVDEFHIAMVDLAALDGLACGASAFGAWPDVMGLRHPIACPDLKGHWQSEVTPRREAMLAEVQ